MPHVTHSARPTVCFPCCRCRIATGSWRPARASLSLAVALRGTRHWLDVALVGTEGMVGLPLLLGVRASSSCSRRWRRRPCAPAITRWINASHAGCWRRRTAHRARDLHATGRWDAARIGQMLSNLISNAVQHGAAQPVSVTVTGAEDVVSVQVHNKGDQIPAAVQQNLFTPLRQTRIAEGERRAGSSGLGLGLYIAREIAVAHGGCVAVESGDEGTTFRVRLPRVAKG